MSCIFCDFVSGKRAKHTNGLPFKVLNETKNTISFLSVDFPATEDGHTLVIPKRHFENLWGMPKKILSELAWHVLLASKVIRNNHEGCNVLLNDGKSAGQYIMHAHFHIIPRDGDDDIRIELWKRKKLSLKRFEKLYNKLKKDFNALNAKRAN